jgi:hypothetical protein
MMGRTEEGMPINTGLREYRVYTAEDTHFVHVPAGRGEELRTHLHAHGIAAGLSPVGAADYDRVEVPREITAETLQVILDHWER